MIRKVKEIYKGRDTFEGAGVRLKRIFGFYEAPRFDPFLMLDDFGSRDPEDYIAGFPWHPHRGIQAKDIPEFMSEDGIKVKVIAGRYRGLSGPVKDIICEPEYLDVYVPPRLKFEHPVKKGHTVFASAFEGNGAVGQNLEKIQAGSLVLFGDGDKVVLETGLNSFRFLLVSGKPIGEPIAWRGPIVMNTEEELALAFKEYQNGAFIK